MTTRPDRRRLVCHQIRQGVTSAFFGLFRSKLMHGWIIKWSYITDLLSRYTFGLREVRCIHRPSSNVLFHQRHQYPMESSKTIEPEDSSFVSYIVSQINAIQARTGLGVSESLSYICSHALIVMSCERSFFKRITLVFVSLFKHFHDMSSDVFIDR
ncbi:hypothetical protein METSCH_A03270 [Metschnikowia aff. pulcherrima]|uniref:Uncharacterized protein n=1 Tax=Metschnikowia aff. pulcherrima TaxID=2163413 RepID=A0A4P6XDV4_9ASCO|nr:hypothetical protein METSCH_A03270 [Metschnikowia aff. pulcherrima]